jgi:lysine N6-hydroxylase
MNSLTRKVYDIIGIGIGPFNLGLAALSCAIPDLSCIFFDQGEGFDWHPGLLIEGSRLQVPFFADLVTLADPCSEFSYLAYLKATGNMFRFAIHEQYFPTRIEYNRYCQWAAAKLSNLNFGKACKEIRYNEQARHYSVTVEDVHNSNQQTYLAKHIVIGIGTTPQLPTAVKNVQHPNIFHSSDYLRHKRSLLKLPGVTIVGSGQSAAEIFYDLLDNRHYFSDGLSWFTRAERFYPMEYSKLTLEMTSPDYIDHFYSLDEGKKSSTIKKQDMLYKGINYHLINDIYDKLYLQSLFDPGNPVNLCTNCELKSVMVNNRSIEAGFYHSEKQSSFVHSTSAVILATGYKQAVPNFIHPINHLIKQSKQGLNIGRNYSIDANNSIFIQNADQLTHGFNAADLGMGPYRNAIIINTILGHEHFKLENNIAFQSFGPPG